MQRLGAFITLTGLVLTLWTAFAPVNAVPINPGVVGGFEIEGDQDLDGAGTLDWANVTPTVVTDDTADSGLAGSSKENDPSGWVCSNGGASPPKSNILHAAVNTRIEGDQVFLDLAYVRATGNGNSHVNFEFNQNQTTLNCPSGGFTGRTDGDLLLLFNFSGSGTDVAGFVWDSTISSDGEWVAISGGDFPPGAAAGASNADDITNILFPGITTIGDREFGEASLELTAIYPSGPEDDCVSFGSLNVRSRSASGNQEEESNSINSALQDVLPPTDVDLSTCGRVILTKTDDAGNALAGAVFGLFATQQAAETRDAANAVDTCTTDASGTCTFEDVDPGSYFVAEISAPDGYDIDADIIPVTVAELETVTIQEAFVDPRQVGFVRIVKVLVDGNDVPVVPTDPSVLDGATFVVYQDADNDGSFDAGEEAHLWPNPPADGSDIATCTITGGTGSCDIGPLATGTYRITETVVPPDTMWDGDVDVTVAETTADQPIEVTATNVVSPINIALDKSGPDTANVGDTITYTFDVNIDPGAAPLHDVVLTDDSDVCDSDPVLLSGDDGDGVLEVGETWRYTCTHIVTLADPDPLPNTASVEGTDPFGREVSTSDTHTVDILYANVSVEKDAVDDTISAGQSAGFTITVTVDGDAGAIARDVSLTDQLPDAGDITWTENSDDCSIDGNGLLTCNFGDMTVGDPAQAVTVTGTTTTASCGDLVNEASVAAANEPTANQSDNSDGATVTVSCPDVSVVKVAADDEVSAGDPLSFTITVANNDDTGTATGVTLTDNPLPAGVSWALGGADADDCAVVGNVLSCNFGDIEPNGTRMVTLTGTSDPADCGVLTNTATVASTNEAPGNDQNNGSTAIITVLCPDVGVEKTADTPEVNANEPVSFTIKVTVGGDDGAVAKNVTLTDPLPPGSWTLTGDTEGCPSSPVSGALACDLGDLAEGESRTITLTRDSSAADCPGIINTATVSADNEPANDQLPNSGTASIVVNCPDIGIEKTADADSVSAGGEIGFTITVSNAGPGVASGVTITDALPPGFAWQEAPDLTNCSITNGALTCNVGDLEPLTEFPVHVEAVTTPADCGDHTNTAFADADNDDQVTDDAGVRVRCPIAIDLDKVGPDMVHVGDTITYEFTVTNTGGEDLVDVDLTDPICDNEPQVVDDGDGDETLSVGETWQYECTHVVTADDPDPLPNSATVVGTEARDPANTTEDTDDHEVDIIHPSIEIVKEASPISVSPGDSVTFTYSVTNVGDIVLTNVVVTDDVLGAIGVIDSLAPGEAATLSQTVTIEDDSPILNVGTVTGDDPLGLTVSDDDDATISIVLPSVAPKPAPPKPELPRTGIELMRQVMLGLGLLMIGSGAALFAARKRAVAVGALR